jgi:hypothetical protein
MTLKGKLINLIVEDFLSKNDIISVMPLQRELDKILKFKTTVNDIVIFDGILTGSIFFRDNTTNAIKSVTFIRN